MALPRREPRRPRHLVAAAYQAGGGKTEFGERKALSWQQRCLAYIDLIPELNYASRFYARMLKQLRIYPAFLNEKGELEEISDGLAVEALDRIQDPGGGRSQILGNYGRLMFITGEGSLFGRDLNTEDERWSFIWNEEVKVELNSDRSVKQFIHEPTPDKKTVYGPDQAVLYRLWTPHPRRSGEADSPMRSAQEIAEELIILTKSVLSTATTRMTKGILFMPSEIAPPPAEPVGDEDPENDPYVADLIESFRAQQENPGSPAANSPLVSWVMNDYISNIRHIPLHDPANDYMERELRREAIERLARGFDFPPEVLLGLSEANHWAARQILDDMWRSHGAPIAEQFCDDLNDAYLRKTLRTEGFADWERVVIGFDESQVVVKPDRADDAIRAYAAMPPVIGAQGVRQMLNINDELAPSPEELEAIIEARKGPATPQPSEPEPDDADEGPPAPGPEGDSGRRTRETASVPGMEMGAAAMALARCRELAGIRIRQKEKVCPECVANANGHPNALVASLVGADNIARLDLSPVRLVNGGADTLRDMLTQWSYAPTQAAAICEMVEVYAARTLFEQQQPPLPAGFSAYLERAKEASDVAH